jgi:Na+/melibiose symporter-like transporter
MIVTRKKHIPSIWILLAVAPWSAYGFAGATMGNVFLFSLKKFVENPAGLTFILTLPSYISIVSWPCCSFLSDRIWTRFGRRKPFILASWTGMLTSLVLMPFMPTLWTLVATYTVFSVSSDLGAPLEPLKQEIVPPHQRGMATAVMSWIGNIAGLLFAFVALGRFDDVRFMSGHLVPGEALLYWAAGLVLFVTFFVLVVGIKEINPHSPLVGQKLSVKSFFTAILDHDLWPVYILIFGAAMLGAGLGPLGNLLYTDQWSYSKQDMGTNIAVGGVINIFVIGVLAFIADRLDRMKAYQVLITISLFVQFFYYIYVEFLLPDRRPSLVEIIFFGETLSILGTLTNLIYIPLVYDYIIRDKMGTYVAGSGLLNRLTGIITLNVIGLFVWSYALLFQPPAGDMARVCLSHEASAPEVASLLQRGSWRYPENEGPAPGSQVTASAWYSTGMIRDTGACWEIRLRDKKSEAINAQIENLQGDLTPLLADEKMLRDDAKIDSLRQDKVGERLALHRADAKKTVIDQMNAKLNPLETEVDARAENFGKQVATVLQPDLLQDGNQIMAAHTQAALVIEMPVREPPSTALEEILIDLRRQGLNVIDLRPTKRGNGYGLAISALLEPGADETSVARKLVETTVRLAAKRAPKLFPSPASIISQRHQTAVVLDLKIVEVPLDNQISPITQVVNSLLALIDSAPQPEHRLAAIARSLRLKGETEHVGIEPENGNEHAISVVTLLLPQAAKSDAHDAIAQRLQKLLGTTATPDMVAETRAFYDRLVGDAEVQRVTIQQPILSNAYVAMRYDYMSGYIPMFLLGLIGLAITFGFGRRERKGLIRKLGVEEAENS